MVSTISELILSAAQRYHRKTALMYKRDGHYIRYSFAELQTHVRDFSCGLAQLGLVPKDKVAILSPNNPQWVVADIATMHAGGVVVPVHSTYSRQLIAHVLNHSHAKFLVVSGQDLFHKILLLLPELPHVRTIIYADVSDTETPPSGISVLAWDDVLRLGGSHSFAPPKVLPTDLATIVYTSGTTGVPKGVMLSHNNIVSNVQASLEAVPVTSGDTLLSMLPLSHVLERTAGYYIPLSQGAKIGYAESSKTIAQNLLEVRPTIMVAVPRLYTKVHQGVTLQLKKGPVWRRRLFYWALHQPTRGAKHWLADHFVLSRVRQRFGGRLRLSICGGARLPVDAGKFFQKIGINILEGYGLTETSPVIAVNRLSSMHIGTVGASLGGVEVAIGADKELLVRGPNVMMGYYRDDQATAAVLSDAGWLSTGDLAWRDAQGHITIIGRKKEMMVTSTGKNIWPESIENAILVDRYFNQVCVIGHEQPYLTALIVPQWNEVQIYLSEQGIAKTLPEQLCAHDRVQALIRERLDRRTADLPDHEQIVKFILLPREFTQEHDQLTPTLKLRRQAIANQFASQIDSLYRS